MKSNNYINEAIKNPRYTILFNGKEAKKYAFYRQAKNFCMKHNGKLFSNDTLEILDTVSGEIQKI